MQSSIQESLFRASARFMRRRWPLTLGISAAVLVPCFWHRHIEAGDLGSHIYNAWLAELVRRGQLPGLWIVPQWHNVAFDLLLSAFGKIFGWLWAEKLGVSVCVLIFFWGAFALASAAARRAPLFLTPVIAIISFGWTFQQGFINYYLAVGLAFFALAILWRGIGRERFAALAFVPLIFLAHPLGLMWLVGGAAYILVAERLQRYRIFLFSAAVLLVISIGLYVQHHYFVYRSSKPPYIFNGADQIVLYSRAYGLVAVGIFLFVLVALASEVRRRRTDPEFLKTGGILLQLYLILQCLVLVLPFGVYLPGYSAPLTFLPQRLTTLSAVLICGLLGLIRPRKWHSLAYAAAAVMFFSLLYRDTGIINNMEEQSDRLVANLPFGRRVLFTIPERGSRLKIGHFVDRSCIDHCFSYGNYEPSTGQFRLRAMPGNGAVMTQVPDVWRMEDGAYEVTSNDLPADEIYQCGEKGRQVCLRPLEAGEKNYRPLKIKGSPFDVGWPISVSSASTR
ncbi:MAG: hypothetical protein JWO71_2837 [Candidatus Acidoferrum typicum]|nr:hypothetical protein [Candidatus Acidoferrum typicum]